MVEVLETSGLSSHGACEQVWPGERHHSPTVAVTTAPRVTVREQGRKGTPGMLCPRQGLGSDMSQELTGQEVSGLVSIFQNDAAH